jgi:predicted MFS family arabinose efflux permease
MAEAGARRFFLLLFAENFLFSAAHGSLCLLSPWLERLGASRAFIGAFNSMNTFALVVVLSLFGRALTRARRVACLRWGFALFVAADCLMAFVPMPLGLLLPMRLLGSFSYIFSSSFLTSMVYDISSLERQTGDIALFGVSGLVSNPFSSYFGELVFTGWGERGLLLFSAALGVLAALVALCMREPEQQTQREPPVGLLAVLRRADLRPLIVTSFIFGSAFTLWLSFLPAFTTERLGYSALTAFTLPFACVSVLMRVLFGRQMNRAEPRALLVASSAMLTLSFALIVFTHSLVMLCLVGAIYGFAHSILFPLLSSLHVRAGGDRQKPAFNNAFIVESCLGAMVLVPLAGFVGDWLGFSALFGLMFVLSAFCLALAIRPARNRAAR